MDFKKLKDKFSISNLFSFNEIENSIDYNESLIFKHDHILVHSKQININDINYFFFDKTSYLYLNRSELKSETFEFFVTINHGKNEEVNVRIFSSDDWIVIQEVLRQSKIIVHTANSLRISNDISNELPRANDDFEILEEQILDKTINKQVEDIPVIDESIPKIDKDLNKLFADLIDEDEVIVDTKYRDGDFLYVFTQTIDQKNNPDDDRYRTVGGKGPIRLNLVTNEFERIHYLDFPSELIKPKPTPDLDQISKGIAKRKYVNEDDVYNFVRNTYGDDFGAVFYDIFSSRDEIHVIFKKTEITDELVAFLKENCINYSLDIEGKLTIDRIPLQ